MAISGLLDSLVGQMESVRKVYLSPSQHINDKTTIRIGYAYKDGEWVKADKSENPRKKKRSEGPSSSQPESHDELVIQGMVDLKLDISRVEASLSDFKEEVRLDLQHLHRQQGEISSQLEQLMHLVTACFPPPVSSPPIPSASSPSSAQSSSSSICPDI